MRKVAITQRVVEHTGYRERRDALAQDWAHWLARTYPRATLLPVPNALHDVRTWLDVVTPDALILSGGNGWGEAPERDQTEQLILDWFRERRSPVLAACRGLQAVNVMLGGTITRDLASSRGTSHVAIDHEISLSHEYLPGDHPQEPVVVNSYHDDGVLVDQVAPTLHVFARSGDVVEGLTHAAEDILAIQWHPERAHPASAFTDQLIRAFFDGELPGPPA